MLHVIPVTHAFSRDNIAENILYKVPSSHWVGGGGGGTMIFHSNFNSHLRSDSPAPYTVTPLSCKRSTYHPCLSLVDILIMHHVVCLETL